MLIGVRVDLEVRCLMTGRQSAAAAAEAVESLGRPLKAHRVLVGGGGVRSPDLVKAFPCSFTSSASPPPAALTLAASFRIQMQRKLANPYPLTTHLSPRFIHSISASVSFPQHVCIFLSTSPPLIPLLPTTSLLFPSLNVPSVTLPVHLHLFLPNPVSPLPPPTHPFSTSLPPVEQNIQQYINPHTSL